MGSIIFLHLFYCIFGFIDKFVIDYLYKVEDLKKNENLSDWDFNLNLIGCLILNMCFSEIIFSLIFGVFSLYYLLKKDEDIREARISINRRNTEVNIIKNEEEYIDIEKEKSYYCLKIPFISFFDILSFIPLYIYQIKMFREIQINISLTAFLLLFSSIFSYCYLNYPIYCHHWIGIILDIIGFLLFDVDKIFLSKKLYLDINFNIIYGVLILLQIPISWKDIFEKDVIENDFFNIYKLLFFEGLLGLLFTVILIFIFLFAFKVKCIISSIYLFWINNYLWYLIIYCLSCGFFNICRIKINQKYGPIHKVICNIFIYLIVWGYFSNKDNLIIEILCFIFQIFGALIFIEIISFSCCNQNTRKEKTKRAEEKFGQEIRFVDENELKLNSLKY